MKNEIDKEEYFKLPERFENFILSQYQSHTDIDSIFTGGYRLERLKNDPPHYYKLASLEKIEHVKNYYKKEIDNSSWENMTTYFFVDYHNYQELTYTMYEIDRAYDNKDWETFVNDIPTTRITGCGDSHFQRALQENHICFKVGFTCDQRKFDDWMKVPFNKEYIKVIKHSNIGNY